MDKAATRPAIGLWPTLDATWQDVRHGLRMMRAAPLFAATAIIALALGIGANTAIFSIVRAVLLAPLAYHEPDRLVAISLDKLPPNLSDGPFPLTRLEHLRAAAHSFTAVGAFLRRPEEVTLSGGGGEPETLVSARVSANMLDILGVRPIAGRGFLAAEDQPGAAPAVMIGESLWRRRFQADPHIAGASATFDAIPHTIVGVLPDDFAFPFPDVDVWVTQPSETVAIAPRFRRVVTMLVGFARLKPGASLTSARAEMAVLNRAYLANDPTGREARAGAVVRLQSMQDRLVVHVRPMLWILLGAVALVLLIACANVAGLLLARASSRSRELAVRAALGAARGRLIRQLLAESLVLSAAGGAIGVLVAWWGLHAIARTSALAQALPRASEIRMDGAVLAFTVGLSMLTGVVFGAIPALQASRPALGGMLRDRAASPGWGSPARRTLFRMGPRGLLVSGQVALSIVLLIAAMLLVKSLARLRGVEPGFHADGLLTMKIALPLARYDAREKRAAFQADLARRAAAVPGARGAAIAKTLPTTFAIFTNLEVPGRPDVVEPGDHAAPLLQSVTPDYFRVMGVPVRRGRVFAARDDSPGAPPVIVINERLARRFWPEYPRGTDPVGQRMIVPLERVEAEIIGIVADVRERGLAVDGGPVFYLLPAVHASQAAYLAVRVDGDPLRLADAMRREVRRIDGDQAVSEVKTMAAVLDATLGPRRLTLLLLAAFAAVALAAVALALAATGIYGTIAYAVAQRTQEVGVRRALGATRGDILTLIVRQALHLALAGVACGLAGAFAVTRLLRTLLFDVSATDPATFAGVALTFLLVALIAGLLPAWRATRIDPMAALRS